MRRKGRYSFVNSDVPAARAVGGVNCPGGQFVAPEVCMFEPHVFVICADLTKLACDAFVVRTDSRLDVSPAFVRFRVANSSVQGAEGKGRPASVRS